MTPPEEPPPDPEQKPLNAFQLLGSILAATVGIHSRSQRGSEFARAGCGTLLGAVLIFVAVAGFAVYWFVRLVKS